MHVAWATPELRPVDTGAPCVAPRPIPDGVIAATLVGLFVPVWLPRRARPLAVGVGVLIVVSTRARWLSLVRRVRPGALMELYMLPLFRSLLKGSPLPELYPLVIGHSLEPVSSAPPLLPRASAVACATPELDYVDTSALWVAPRSIPGGVAAAALMWLSVCLGLPRRARPLAVGAGFLFVVSTRASWQHASLVEPRPADATGSSQWSSACCLSSVPCWRGRRCPSCTPCDRPPSGACFLRPPFLIPCQRGRLCYS